MQIRVGIVLWASILVAVTCAVGQDQSTRVVNLVRQLSGDTFDQRQVAMRDLVKVGIPAIVALTQAITESDPETRWRAARVLEEIGLQGDERTLRKVTRIMHLLGSSGVAGLGEKCHQMRELWLDSQVKKVTDRLTELGATVDVMARYDAGFGDVSPAIPMHVLVRPDVEMPSRSDVQTAAVEDTAKDAGDRLAESNSASGDPIRQAIDQIISDSDEADEAAMADLKIQPAESVAAADDLIDMDELLWSENSEMDQIKFRMITIDANWKGSDEDLRLLGRVSRLIRLNFSARTVNESDWESVADIASLQFVLLDQCDYEVTDAFKFRKQRPDVNVRVIGRGFLGVMGPLDGNVGDCVVSQVVAGTGADRAGLKADDEITSIDGKSVRAFQDLILIVGSHQPGDEIELEYRRAGELQKTTAVLQPRNQFDR